MTQKKDTSKKPFDKKKWREKKYSKHFKVKQWEEKRQKGVLRTYFKELKKQGIAENGLNRNRKRLEKIRNANSLSAAVEEYTKLRVEINQRFEEIKRRREEIRKSLEKYKKNKAEKFKKLSRKTHRGQPKMKEKMELLLGKIEKVVSND